MKKKSRNEKPHEDSFIESYAKKAGLDKTRKTSGRKYVIYLSGNITDDPNYRIKFNLAEYVLTKLGHVVINPAKADYDAWTEALAADLSILGALAQVSMIYRRLLPEIPYSPAVMVINMAKHVPSRGVLLEMDYARINGIPVMHMEEPVWSQILYNAIKNYQGNMP